MQEMSDTLRATFRRVLKLENRRAAVRPGRVERITDFKSAILGNTREITIYVPAGYDDGSHRRYPTLYAQDGQNLIDPHRSFIPGQHWRLSEAADAAIGERTASPMIIVRDGQFRPFRSTQMVAASNNPTMTRKRRPPANKCQASSSA